MAELEIKQVQEAADAFKDDKIDQAEAKKIAETLDTNKVKSEDVQDFIEHSNTYSSVIDGLITNIEKYTKPEAFIGLTLPGDKKLQIVDNKVPLKSLTDVERNKIISDAAKFLTRIKEEKVNLEKKKNTAAGLPPSQDVIGAKTDKKIDKKNMPYDANKPLESMLNAIDANLPEDKKMNQGADVIRANVKKGIMNSITVELDKRLQNGEKKTDIKNAITERIGNELTEKRMNNMIIGGLYVSINSIDKKINSPLDKKGQQSVDNMGKGDFSLLGAHILHDVSSIEALLKVDGNIIDNLTKNSKDKIINKIKSTFPKLEVALKSKLDLKEDIKNRSNNPTDKGFYFAQNPRNNPITEIFMDDIHLDSELEAVNYIEKNNGLPESTKEQLGMTGLDIQNNIVSKVEKILNRIPTTDYEKKAMETELIQNKFSGWSKSLLESIYNLAQKLGFGDLLNMFNKDGLFDKVLLSKSRNDALIAKKLYIDGKGKNTNTLSVKEAPEDLQNILKGVDMESTLKTLNNCKKFISPVMGSGGQETEDTERAKNFMSQNGEYNKDKVDTEFTEYVKAIGKDRKTEIKRPIEKDKVKTEKIYTYKDLIKNDADLVENFMQYVQTGQLPNGYSDKKIYENMKDLGTESVVTTPPEVKKEASANTKDIPPLAPNSVESKTEVKPREKTATDFATSVKGKAFPSKLWTDSYAVEYVVNGKKAVKMFKSPTAQKISK